MDGRTIQMEKDRFCNVTSTQETDEIELNPSPSKGGVGGELKIQAKIETPARRQWKYGVASVEL